MKTGVLRGTPMDAPSARGEPVHAAALHLCNCDAVISDDMLIVMAYLAAEPTVYADAWGYRDAMAARMIPLRHAIDIMTGEPIDAIRDARGFSPRAASRSGASASGLGRGLSPRRRVEIGHGLRRRLAVAAGFLTPLAACDDQSRLVRVEAEITRISRLNHPATGQNDR